MGGGRGRRRGDVGEGQSIKHPRIFSRSAHGSCVGTDGEI